MEKKSNGFLKVTGILLIIGGSLSIILGVAAVACASVIAGVASAVGETGAAGLLMVATILILVGGVISLIAGIMGVKNAAKPEKASQCILWGLLVIAFSLVGNVINLIGGSGLDYVGLLTGLVLPALYLLGAFQSKKLAG